MNRPISEMIWSRWDEVDRLYGKALALVPDQRDDFLSKACGDDVALLETVSTLLRSSDRAATDLVGPGPELFRAAFSDSSTYAALEGGEKIGRWRLTRPLGQGGMAAVFEAERADGAFESRVAIKLLQGVGSEELARRFAEERQILSSLSHPTIARLLDGGSTEDGRPYLVMDLVEGERITDWVVARNASVRERAALFLQVVDAVQYAHTRLVVHRDLKPSNVLVDAQGHARLLDFGIAKLLDTTSDGLDDPRPATRWMTPQYAAPEQILARAVTTATDVYGLGTLLYELLTAQRPFGRGLSGFELEQAICEVDPAPMSATVDDPRIKRSLEGDLDAIVAKALRKAPEERYPSAQAMGDDLRRWLTGFPVTAHQGLAAYRARKFVARHRAAVATAAGVAVVLLGSAAALARLQAETAEQRDMAAREAARAEAEAEKGREVIGFLADVFRGSSPDRAPSDTITARELLDWGTERVEREFADRPELRAELLLVLGWAHRNLGLMEEGLALIERGVALRRETRDPALVGALLDLGDAYRIDRAFEPARSAFLEAIESLRDDPEQTPLLARALRGLALSLPAAATDSAVTLLTQAVRIRSGAPNEAAYLGVRMDLALALRRDGRLEEARATYEDVLPRYRALPEHDPTTLATGLNNLAYLKTQQQDWVGAESLYRESLLIMQDLYGEGHPNALVTSNNLAVALQKQGRVDEAVAMLRGRVRAAEAQWPEGDWRVGSANTALAALLLQEGRIQDAEGPLRAAVGLYTRLLGEEHLWTAFALGGLAVIGILDGDPEAGHAYLDQLHSRADRYARERGPEALVSGLTPLPAFVAALSRVGLVEEHRRFAAIEAALTSSAAAKEVGGP